MNRLKRGTLAAAVVATAGLVLSACGVSNHSSPEEVDRDFVIGWGDVEGIDPIQYKSEPASLVVANIYDGVLQQNFTEADGYLDGQREYTGSLAESIEYSEGGEVATIKLRDGLRFADGSPLTSADVVYTIHRTLSDASYVAGSSKFFMHISDPESQVVALDDRTVQITLDSPSASHEAFLALHSFGILQAAAGEANAGDDWAKSFFVANATPSGAFDLAGWEPGQRVVLQRNENYYDAGSVFADSVTIQNIPDSNQLMLAVKSGDIDVAVGLSPRQVSELENDPAVDVVTVPTSWIMYLGMNNDIAPFEDVRVRQAIASAIPYDEIRKAVMMGYAQASYGAVPYGMETSIAPDAETSAWETDLDLARKLLAEAGATDLTITLSIPSSSSIGKDVATYVQAALAEIGVTVVIEQLADADFQTKSSSHELSFFFDNWFSWSEDPFYQMRALFLTDRVTNSTGYSNKAFDDAVLAGIVEVDPAKRQQLSSTAQQLLIDESPAAFLFTQDFLVVTTKGVSGITVGDDLMFRLKYLHRE